MICDLYYCTDSHYISYYYIVFSSIVIDDRVDVWDLVTGLPADGIAIIDFMEDLWAGLRSSQRSENIYVALHGYDMIGPWKIGTSEILSVNPDLIYLGDIWSSELPELKRNSHIGCIDIELSEWEYWIRGGLTESIRQTDPPDIDTALLYYALWLEI